MATETEPENKENMFSEPSRLSDITLLIEDKRLYLNKTVLAIASPVFDKMLTGDFKEKSATEIPLPGKKYDEMLVFLMCIYPSTVKPITRENLDILLPLADEYQIESLKERCDAFIVNMVEKKKPTLKELIHLLVLGGRYRLENAVKCCVVIASREKFSEMKKESEFADISSDVKYRFTSLQLERYEEGVKNLRVEMEKKTSRIKVYRSAIYTCSFHQVSTGGNCCTHCIESCIPDIVKTIDKFSTK